MIFACMLSPCLSVGDAREGEGRGVLLNRRKKIQNSMVITTNGNCLRRFQ